MSATGHEPEQDGLASRDATTFRPPPFPPRGGGALRWILRIAAGLGVVVLFVASLIVGVLVHLDTRPARRLAVTEVDALLASELKGRVRIERLGSLNLFGLSDTDVTVDDPSGRPVLSVRGARVRLSTFDALRSALLGKQDPLDIRLSLVSADRVDVRLDSDASGQLDLLDAFSSRTPSRPSDPKGRGLRLTIARISLGHVWAHGQMAGAPPLDVDLDTARGTFAYTPDVLEGDLSTKVEARKIANGADVSGALQAHVKDPSDPAASLEGNVAWEGLAAGIEHSLRASLRNKVVDAVVDVPRAEPDEIRALWADSPIVRAASAHAEVHGPLSDVDVSAAAKLGEASVDVRGHLVLEEEKTARLALEAHDLDAHDLVASAPVTRVGLTGELSADMKAAGDVSGEANLRFLGGTVAGRAVPPATIRATGARSAAGVLQATADLAIDEPGAPTHVAARLFPKGQGSAVDFELQASSVDLLRVPELGRALHGSFRMTGHGEVDLGARAVDGSLELRATGLSHGPNRVASAVIEGRARGALANPDVDVLLQTRGVEAGGLHVSSADVHATGDATAPTITASLRGKDLPDVEARTDLGLRDGVSLAALRVDLSRRGVHGVLTARDVKLGGGNVRVDDARLDGVGAPLTATLGMTPRTLSVRSTTRGLDLTRIARLANLEQSLLAGTLSFDADVAVQRESARGRATLDLVQASYGKARDVSAHVALSMDGRSVTGKAHVEAGRAGTVDLDVAKIEVAAGVPLLAASWRDLAGTADIKGRADLAKVAEAVPQDRWPLGPSRGEVLLEGRIARKQARGATPDVELSITTERLDVSARTETSRDIDGVIVYPPAAWRIAGLDFAVEARAEAETGHASLSVQAHDAEGTLARLDASAARLPLAELFQKSEQLEATLRATPVDLHLVVPERGLGKMPELLKQDLVSGRLQADVKAHGTLAAPIVEVTAALHHANFAATGLTQPMDVELTGRYDGARGDASVHAQSGSRRVLDLTAQAEAEIGRLLASRRDGSEPPWKASAKAHFDSFPMASIASLDDKLVSGLLSGDVSLANLHADATAQAQLVVDQLSVGSVGYKSAKIQLTADGHVLDGDVRVDQTDGFLEAKAHALASWGAALAPALDRSQPLGLSLSARNFRIAALLPFVDGALDELDGRVDADTQLRLDPVGNKAQLSGTVELTRGTIEAAAGGGELHDMTASVKLAPDGTVTLEKLTAKGLTGQLEVTGTARLDGTSLESAKAVVVIPSHSPIPFSTGGSEIGNVDGRIEVSETTSEGGKAMAVKVEVPRLRVALPQGNSTNAQALGEMDARVRIGAHRGDPSTFVLLPLDPVKKAPKSPPAASSSKLTIETHLTEVEVVRGTEIKIDLAGGVNVVDGAGAPRVTGRIHLKPGGVLDVQGRKFEVDNGTVTFVGTDPSDPDVVVKASWAAPDGTMVHANFVGPLKTGKVTLSSDPGLPQQEIVQLLAFGSADGTQPQGSGAAAGNGALGAAGGVAGGEAAQPINHALGQMGLGAVSANIDTTQSANPRPEVEVQIAKDISLQIAVVLGQPPPGVNPDRTLLTIDWRFLSKWSLASTVGDAGTTIFDLLWQRRY